MAAFLIALRRLGALAAVAGLLTQSLLPAVHSWQVEAEETAYHASVHDAAPQASVCDDHARDHHHHSDADCPLCPLYSSARLAAVHALSTASPPSRLTALQNNPSLLGSSAAVSGAPVRGPPAVLPA